MRWWWLSFALVGCDVVDMRVPVGPDGGAAAMDAEVPEDVCRSGRFRDPNESEGPEMMPGHACNACHREENAASGEGDAPIFAAAGTVYAGLAEPDNCLAPDSEDTEVVITDARGQSYSATVNASGNFLLEVEAFAFPLRAKIVRGGRERAMSATQKHGDCNACHGATGLEGAPGRIILP